MAIREAVVRARIDQKLKDDSESILRQLGLSTTEAIRMFFTQITLQRGLPFAVTLQPDSEANSDLLLPRAKRQAALDVLDED